CFFFKKTRAPTRYTQGRWSAGSVVYKKQDKAYTILVMGFSSKILFSSHNKIKEFNSNKYD
ncbi:hypothetical protein COH59_12400, partial [Neisseria meningitidis]